MPQAITTTAEQRKSMNATLDALFRWRDELMLLDMRAAAPDKFAEYNKNLYDVGIAISLLNGGIMRSISSDFAEQLPKFEAATKKVAADLYSLRKTSAVLNAVSQAMSTVTSIIALAK